MGLADRHAFLDETYLLSGVITRCHSYTFSVKSSITIVVFPCVTIREEITVILATPVLSPPGNVLKRAVSNRLSSFDGDHLRLRWSGPSPVTYLIDHVWELAPRRRHGE
jgi:hypothetical protein